MGPAGHSREAITCLAFWRCAKKGPLNLLKHTRPMDTERIINLTQQIADRKQATKKKGKEEGGCNLAY